MVGVRVKKQQKTIPIQQQREALAALHRLRKAYSEDISYEVFKARESLRDETLQALSLFTDMVYGERAFGQSFLLCDGCHMARALNSLPCDERGFSLFLCATCYQQYQQQQARVQTEPREPETAPPVEGLQQEGTS